ncbi:hypothetical protein ONS95_005781 [Cadophora gregata]|uniref:uncharacterized protein n=1 Tax=Cadophora gregata TaxID=51156 RepID=UPI0026DC340A|nr:uncharacterized protein ONS95_005781 [Cadophora gregata]KAK0103779.1 hypothetical protein ONS95_005781 [Cadophora gregata]KAK0107965.1 hypothetical protein ONS96_003748 [Cadophora gregata f. sp. sojae]
MSMIFNALDERIDYACPSCRMTSHVNSDSEIECLTCGTWYQRIIDLDSSPSGEGGFDSANGLCPQMRDGSDGKRSHEHDASTRGPQKRRLEEVDLGDEDIRAFRRVRLLYTRKSSDGYIIPGSNCLLFDIWESVNVVDSPRFTDC